MPLDKEIIGGPLHTSRDFWNYRTGSLLTLSGFSGKAASGYTLAFIQSCLEFPEE
jgi:hypothetical protein